MYKSINISNEFPFTHSNTTGKRQGQKKTLRKKQKCETLGDNAGTLNNKGSKTKWQRLRGAHKLNTLERRG